jgi:hypothetical protein
MSKKSKGKGLSLADFQKKEQEAAQKKQQELLAQQQQAQKLKEQQQKQKKQEQQQKKQQQQQNKKPANSAQSTPTSTPTTATSTQQQFAKVHFQPNNECQEIIKVLVQVIGQDRVDSHLDQPMLNYFASVLHAQNSPATRVPEKEVLDLLSLFIVETRTVETPELGSQMAQSIVSELRSKQLLSQVEIEQQDDKRIKLLDEAINLGRTFEDQMKQDEILNSVAQQVNVNYNESLDWEQKVIKERKEKKQKRDQKMRDLKMKEYNEYLKQRGLSSGKGIVKLHNAEEVSGSRDVNLLHRCS